jgi:aspartate kinase
MTVENIENLSKAVSEMEALGTVSISKNMAILSLVGRGQKHCVGLAGRMFSVLGNKGINIEMISQGASEINVSCVVKDEYADRALKVIHTALVK